MHKRWTEYYTELYNYILKTDAIIAKSEDELENRETGVSATFKRLKDRSEGGLQIDKSPGVHNIPVEILKTRMTRHNRYRDRRMSENLDQWTMAQRLDKVSDYSSSEERQHTTMSELHNDQPDLCGETGPHLFLFNTAPVTMRATVATDRVG